MSINTDKEAVTGMNKTQCNFTAPAALAMTAFVVIAVFALARSYRYISGLEEGEWLWKAWQFGPLILAVAGTWAMWCATRDIPWVRGVALCVYTLTVFLNMYVDWFGDESEIVWRTSDSLFMGFSSVAAVRLWISGDALRRVAGLIVAAFGVAMFLGFIALHDHSVIWWTMNPLTMLTALALAAVSFQPIAKSDNLTE